MYKVQAWYCLRRHAVHQACTWYNDPTLNDYFSLFQVRLNRGSGMHLLEEPDSAATIKEWALMLHGTRDAPYTHLPAPDPHSKLAIVKKAHENKKRM